MSFNSVQSIQRVIGYLELGMPEDAWEELAAFPTAAEELKEVRQLRVDVLGKLGRWAEAEALCQPMLAEEPGEVFWWVQGAYCQRRARSIEEAERTLRSALMFHPAESIILYNLSCYACVQGRLDESKELLERAVAVGGSDVFGMALKDEDLEAVRSWILERIEHTDPPSASAIE